MNRDFSGGPVVKTPASTAGSMGLIPGWGIKIPHGVAPPEKKKKIHGQRWVRRISQKKRSSSGVRKIVVHYYNYNLLL